MQKNLKKWNLVYLNCFLLNLYLQLLISHITWEIILMNDYVSPNSILISQDP